MDDRQQHIDTLIDLMAGHRGMLVSEVSTPMLCEIAAAWKQDRDDLMGLRDTCRILESMIRRLREAGDDAR